MYQKFAANRSYAHQAQQALLEKERKANELSALRLLCGRVTEHCEATKKISAPRCDAKTLKPLMEEAIPVPLQAEGCVGLEERLQRDCPTGCDFISSSLLVIAGKPSGEKPVKRDDGSCEMLVRRPLSLSGDCRPTTK